MLCFFTGFEIHVEGPLKAFVAGGEREDHVTYFEYFLTNSP